MEQACDAEIKEVFSAAPGCILSLRDLEEPCQHSDIRNTESSGSTGNLDVVTDDWA